MVIFQSNYKSSNWRNQDFSAVVVGYKTCILSAISFCFSLWHFMQRNYMHTHSHIFIYGCYFIPSGLMCIYVCICSFRRSHNIEKKSPCSQKHFNLFESWHSLCSFLFCFIFTFTIYLLSAETVPTLVGLHGMLHILCCSS